MENTTVGPALTPEEWAKRQIGKAYIEGDEVNIYPGSPEMGFAGPERHALAALALFKQPFGFTQEDVEILRQLPAFARGLGMGNDSEAVAKWLVTLADRIAALLPHE